MDEEDCLYFLKLMLLEPLRVLRHSERYELVLSSSILFTATFLLVNSSLTCFLALTNIVKSL